MSVSHTQFLPPVGVTDPTTMAATPGPWAIETIGLCKSYGAKRVLDSLQLRVQRGRVLALLGPNGAGKTTTVRILATLLAPDAGRARVAGYDVVTDRREVRRRISLTGQYAALDEIQTGRENLEIVGRLLGLSGRRARARSAELLTRFDLVEAADQRVSAYSGGMRRRLDLAAGLIGNPEVVFLDEPTTGLDPRSRQAMWDVVRELNAGGVTVLLTTQYLEEADALADRIVVIDGGRLVAEGSADELKRQVSGARLEIELTDRAALDEAITRMAGRAMPSRRAELTIEIPVQGAAAEIRDLLDELDPGRRRITQFSVHRATLDDVFMALTGQQPHSTETETDTETEAH
jgi:ABC-2 type transport system ATP-binding protein